MHQSLQRLSTVRYLASCCRCLCSWTMCGWMLLPWLYQQDLGRRLDRCCYDQLSLFQLKDTLNLSTVLSTAYFDLILHLLWRLWTLISHGCRHGGSLNMLFQAVEEAFWHRQSGIWTTCFRLTHELAKKMCDAVDQPLTPAVKSITQLWIWLMHWASLQVTTYINTWYHLLHKSHQQLVP